MAYSIEDVNSRTILQQFHSLYEKQDTIETNVENVDAKVDKEKSDRQSADASLRNDINTNTNKIENNTTQISALKSDKQDKLTAGANITIDENNVISASGGASGGKYQHYMIVSSSNYRPHWIIENNQMEAFTKDTLNSYLASKGYTTLRYTYPVNSAIYTHSDEEEGKRYILNISNIDGIYVDKNNILQFACYANQIIFDFTDASMGANKKWEEVNVDFFIDKVTEL